MAGTESVYGSDLSRSFVSPRGPAFRHGALWQLLPLVGLPLRSGVAEPVEGRVQAGGGEGVEEDAEVAVVPLVRDGPSRNQASGHLAHGVQNGDGAIPAQLLGISRPVWG